MFDFAADKNTRDNSIVKNNEPLFSTQPKYICSYWRVNAYSM